MNEFRKYPISSKQFIPFLSETQLLEASINQSGRKYSQKRNSNVAYLPKKKMKTKALKLEVQGERILTQPAEQLLLPE